MKSQIGSFFSSFCSLLIRCYFRDKIPMFKTSYRIFQFLHICFTSWSGVGLSFFISPPIKRCFMNLVKTSHRLLLYFKRLFYLVEWCNIVFGLKYLYKIVAQNIWSKIGLFPFFFQVWRLFWCNRMPLTNRYIWFISYVLTMFWATIY